MDESMMKGCWTNAQIEAHCKAAKENAKRQEERNRKTIKYLVICVVLILIGIITWNIYRVITMTPAEKAQRQADKELRLEAEARAWQAEEQKRLERANQRIISKQILEFHPALTVQKFIPSANPRIETDGSDLTIYLKKSEYQSIPYPDQPKLIKALVDHYCGHLSGVIPTIEVRDIRTGDEFDDAFCF